MTGLRRAASGATARAVVSVTIVLLAALAACSSQEPERSPSGQEGGAAPASPDADGERSEAPSSTTPGEQSGAPSPSPEQPSTSDLPGGPEPRSIQQRIDAMSLREKAGQLLVLSFSGTSAPTSLIDRYRPGGLIYFAENLTSDAQIRALSQQSQQAARAAGQPLLVMTDQEGGIVTRLPGTSDTPAGTSLGGDAAYAARVARATGEHLDSVGVNVDLAPVADVNTVGDVGVIGSRSFSSDPAVAARLTAAQVCGYHRGGVAATAKHFPGHGSTTTDSHLEVVEIDRTAEEWRRIDRRPFAAAQRTDVDLVLVGHLSVPSLDPSGRPATLSSPMLRGELREGIGFDGVVITDSMIMEGITAYGAADDLAVRAVRAGVDLVLMPADPSAALAGIVDAVRSGEISSERLDASVERILTLKQRLGLYASPRSLPQC